MNGTTTTTNGGKQAATSIGTVAGLLRRYLGGRSGLILLAVAVLGIGAFLNWGWLVAAGIAPLLIGLAPCAAMCALGLCMNKMGGKSCSTESKATDQSAGAAPSTQSAEAKPLAAVASAVGTPSTQFNTPRIRASLSSPRLHADSQARQTVSAAL